MSIITEYDGRNNLVAEKNYGESGALIYHYAYQYDDGNNLVSGVSYNEHGSVLTKYSAEFDESGNLIESIHWGPEGEITSRHTARYDGNNRMVEERDYAENTEKIIYLADYDRAGNLLEEIHFGKIRGTGLDYRYGYRYDDRDNRIEEIYSVFLKEENIWKPISKQVNEIIYSK